MSADNYNLVDYRPEASPCPLCKWVVTNQSASADEEDRSDEYYRTRGRWHPTFEAALNYASDEWTEYGAEITGAAWTQHQKESSESIDIESKTDYDQTPGGNMTSKIKATAWSATVDDEEATVTTSIDSWGGDRVFEVSYSGDEFSLLRNGLVDFIALLQHALDETPEDEDK